MSTRNQLKLEKNRKKENRGRELASTLKEVRSLNFSFTVSRIMRQHISVTTTKFVSNNFTSIGISCIGYLELYQKQSTTTKREGGVVEIEKSRRP